MTSLRESIRKHIEDAVTEQDWHTGAELPIRFDPSVERMTAALTDTILATMRLHIEALLKPDDAGKFTRE